MVQDELLSVDTVAYVAVQEEEDRDRKKRKRSDDGPVEEIDDEDEFVLAVPTR
jgi:hypothetical protein